MVWPIGKIGAPKAPCITRSASSVSSELARPHSIEARVKPATETTINVRQPSRAASNRHMVTTTGLIRRAPAPIAARASDFDARGPQEIARASHRSRDYTNSSSGKLPPRICSAGHSRTLFKSVA